MRGCFLPLHASLGVVDVDVLGVKPHLDTLTDQPAVNGVRSCRLPGLCWKIRPIRVGARKHRASDAAAGGEQQALEPNAPSDPH